MEAMTSQMIFYVSCSCFACPREDGYSSVGSDERRPAEEYFQRTFGWTKGAEHRARVLATLKALLRGFIN
jgi:hypothetical protein